MTSPCAFSARMKVPATWASARPSGQSPSAGASPVVAVAACDARADEPGRRFRLGRAQRRRCDRRGLGPAQRSLGERRSGHRRRRRDGLRVARCARARRGGERGADRLAHRLVDFARIAKAHLDLGRMHVDVDALGRDGDEEQVRRLAAAVQDVVVGGAHRVRDQLVAHVAAVDVDVLQVGTRARRLRRSGSTGDRQAAEVDGDGAAVLGESGAEQVARARFGAPARPARHRLAVVPDREGEVGPHQRVPAHRLDAVGELGRLGLQELAPRRRVEEELAHLDRRADAARRGGELAALRIEPHRVRGVVAAAGDRDLGDRGDRRQRLAAKAHRRDAFQVGERGDLAGRVAAQRRRQLGGGNAVAVVLDDDGADAAAGQAHGDAGRAGVDGVVEQLAHDRRRPLDDLAGGDLADQLARQFADRSAHARLEHGVHRRIVESGRCRRARAHGARRRPPCWRRFRTVRLPVRRRRRRLVLASLR